MFLCLVVYASSFALAPMSEACAIVKDPAPYIAACFADDTCEVIETRTGSILLERTKDR